VRESAVEQLEASGARFIYHNTIRTAVASSRGRQWASEHVNITSRRNWNILITSTHPIPFLGLLHYITSCDNENATAKSRLRVPFSLTLIRNKIRICTLAEMTPGWWPGRIWIWPLGIALQVRTLWHRMFCVSSDGPAAARSAVSGLPMVAPQLLVPLRPLASNSGCVVTLRHGTIRHAVHPVSVCWRSVHCPFKAPRPSDRTPACLAWWWPANDSAMQDTFHSDSDSSRRLETKTRSFGLQRLTTLDNPVDHHRNQPRTVR